MKKLYHIVLHKPKSSKTWTPLYDTDRLAIISDVPEIARSRGLEALAIMAAGSNNLAARKLHQWEILVADICMPGEADEAVAPKESATRMALQTILDFVDYTTGNCRAVEMVGAVLPTVLIAQAREALSLNNNK